MDKHKSSSRLTGFQTTVLVLLRVAIGWHLLYQGLEKVLSEGWTARAYLASANWLFADTLANAA